MGKQLLGIVVLGVVAGGLACPTAQAWEAGPFAGPVIWAGTPYSGYSLYVRESIPYFAQHPPVYYSHPVPRPYGFSPYAYPGWVRTPDARYSEAASVSRVARSPEPRVEPLRIVNPYVDPADAPDVEVPDGVALGEPTRPQVVYPASTALR